MNDRLGKATKDHPVRHHCNRDGGRCVHVHHAVDCFMRKKSKYKPKPVLQNPLGFVLENITPITQHEDYLLNLQLKNSSAMERLLKGKADKKDMNTLIAMSNITEALQLMGFGADYKEVGIDGREALIGIIMRAVKIQRFTPTGKEIQSLNMLMELHDAQMDVITVKVMDEAVNLAKKQIIQRQATVLPDVLLEQ
jgi:hypothetical protein